MHWYIWFVEQRERTNITKNHGFTVIFSDCAKFNLRSGKLGILFSFCSHWHYFGLCLCLGWLKTCIPFASVFHFKVWALDRPSPWHTKIGKILTLSSAMSNNKIELKQNRLLTALDKSKNVKNTIKFEQTNKHTQPAKCDCMFDIKYKIVCQFVTKLKTFIRTL